MKSGTAELRRTLIVLGIAVRALLGFVPFLGRLLLSLVAGGPARRRVRELLERSADAAVDEPPAGSAPGPATIYLLAGEDSGDLHAANLVLALRAAMPEARIVGMGGPRMESAGCRLDHDLVRMNVMGIWPVLRAVGTYFSLFRDLLRRLEEDPPDVLVPVDYPGFNLRAARLAKRRGIRVVYYISPQVWAWAPWRLARIARCVDRMLVILPFERELYTRRGTVAAYVGHPLFEHLEREVPARTAAPPVPAARIGLLPGSRRAEVSGLLPWMLDAARRIRESRPEAEFVLPFRRESLRPELERILAEQGKGLPVRLVPGRTHEVMRDLDCALVASGTATLELAYYGVPMAVLYRISRLGSWLRRFVLIVPDVALVNIVAGRRIVPEFVGARNPAERAAAELLGWLGDPARRAEVREELSRVRSRLYRTGVSERAAGFVRAEVSPRPGRS